MYVWKYAILIWGEQWRMWNDGRVTFTVIFLNQASIRGNGSWELYIKKNKTMPKTKTKETEEDKDEVIDSSAMDESDWIIQNLSRDVGEIVRWIPTRPSANPLPTLIRVAFYLILGFLIEIQWHIFKRRERGEGRYQRRFGWGWWIKDQWSSGKTRCLTINNWIQNLPKLSVKPTW